MNWHYIEQGQQAGPVTDQQLQQLFQSGTITADTLVWRQGMADWAPYSQVTIEPAPPAPEAPPLSQIQSTPGENEVVCAECGKLLPAADTVRFGKASVCAACKPIFLQKLSEGAHIDTGDLNYAGFWIRFGAKFIDGLIIGVPMMIIMFAIMIPAMANNKGNPPSPAVTFLPSLVQVGFLFVNMCYQIFFLGKYGATPGKMACKLKVVTSDGAPISYGRATGRFFAELLSGMICDIGYIIAAFDEQKRALHDHICTTRVVYK